MRMTPVLLGLAIGVTPVNAQSVRDRLQQAFFNQADAVFGDDLEELSNRAAGRVERNIRNLAGNLLNQGRNAVDHLLENWFGPPGEPDANRDHVEECPLCYNTSLQLANGTQLSSLFQTGEINLRVPSYFNIGGALYGRDARGLLYRAHPTTGVAIGPAEGYLWFQGTQYYGMTPNGLMYPATPVQ